MSQKKAKLGRRKQRSQQEFLKQSVRSSHLEIIRNYIDDIIELPYFKRRKVCKAIMRKRNPFGKGVGNVR